MTGAFAGEDVGDDRTMCREHPDRHVAGVCRLCECEFCADCLVYSFGELKPPYCVQCALISSGVTPRVALDPQE